MKDKAYNKRYTAFDTAIYYISLKDRTTKEIYNKLEDKGYGEDEINTAIGKLLYYRYLDDKKYALSYIKSNIDKKGIRLITSELMAKGVDKQDILEVLEEIDVDEASTVREIYNRRFVDMDIKDQRQRRKVVSYFLRRGFTYDTINIIFLTH